MNKFKYINRHHKKDIVLLPGWATDHRIFDKLDIEYNYIVPADFDPFSFSDPLIGFLQNNCFKKISLFGWSMGGFAAADFAVKNPYLIDELILVGVKEKYQRDGVEKVKELLLENKKAYLYKFYRDCFSLKDKETLSWFKEKLMADYLDLFENEKLLKWLDYLLATPLDLEALSKMKVKFVYGAADKIVPAAEVMSLKKKMPSAEFIFKENKGHLAF
ncbi:MAG: alpha/beta hydrolase [Candidatus Margulisiibacteriota bacterium]